MDDSNHAAYWRANIRLMCVLLVIWFTVSFGFGILIVEPLNKISLFGFKLGFWWAHQGSIYVFVALIFAYAFFMRRLDRRFGVADDESDTGSDNGTDNGTDNGPDAHSAE